MAETINVDLGDDTINADLGDDTVNVTIGAGFITAFVESDTIFPLNGENGTTGFRHNSASNTIDVVIDGVISATFEKP